MKKPKRKIKNSISLNKLLYNDRFIMCFSIFSAFVLWIIVSSTSSDPDVKTITDISISIPNISNELQVISQDEDVKAEIRVKGNKIVIGSIQSSDILVTADVSEVTAPGEYKLKLSAKKQGIMSDYEFDSTVSPSTITVYVDRNIDKEFTIEENVDAKADGTHLLNPKELANDTVRISGAESVINRIKTVKAEYTVPETLTKTAVFSVPLHFYDENGTEIVSDYITPQFSAVEVTVPVHKVKDVPIKVEFTNIPDTWEMPSNWIRVSDPESGTIPIAASDEVIDQITEIRTEPIDLSQISLNKTTINDVAIEVPTSCTNVSRVEKVTLSLDMKNFASKSIAVKKVQLRSDIEGVTGKLSGEDFNVTIIGPSDEIKSLRASDVILYANLTESEATAAFITKPLQISIENYKSCWWSYLDGQNNATFTISKQTSTSSQVNTSS